MELPQNEHNAKVIRAACCQYAPKLGAFSENVARVETLMLNLHPEDVDLLIFPEMTFTGYMFKSREEIVPFAEDAENGPTVTWARDVAQKLGAHIVIGFPRLEQGADGAKDKYYNSLCFLDDKGETVTVYDKAFLYEVDEAWAEEGPGFVTVDTRAFGRVGLGICMDINPYRFEAPFDRFEWANFHKQAGTNLLILICAWRDNELDSDDSRRIPNYWATRLQPLIGSPVAALICDRVGTEDGVTFTGCSCCISLREPLLLGQLNKRQENILLVDVERPVIAPPGVTLAGLDEYAGNDGLDMAEAS